MKKEFYIALLWSGILALALIGCAKGDSPNLTTQSIHPALLVPSITSTYNFGTVAVNSSANTTITVTNSGPLPATQMGGTFSSSAFSFTGGNYPGQGATCGNTLLSGQTCTVSIAFSPQYAATFQDVLPIVYYNGITSSETTGPTFSGTGN